MPPSPVGQAVPCGYRENTTVFVVCHKHPTVSASLKHLPVRGGAIISLGTAKPLRDLYLTGLAV